MDFLPIGSIYGIYGNIYHQYTPNVSINLPYIRIRHGLLGLPNSWISMDFLYYTQKFYPHAGIYSHISPAFTTLITGKHIMHGAYGKHMIWKMNVDIYITIYDICIDRFWYLWDILDMISWRYDEIWPFCAHLMLNDMMLATPAHRSKPIYFCILLGSNIQSSQALSILVWTAGYNKNMDHFTTRVPWMGLCQPCLITGRQDLYAPFMAISLPHMPNWPPHNGLHILTFRTMLQSLNPTQLAWFHGSKPCSPPGPKIPAK